MGNGGFWLFVIIVVANLVITAIKKSAEKKAAARAAMSGVSSTAASRSRKPARISRTGTGDFELILERVGERQVEVMTVLREVAGLPLEVAADACLAPPSVIANDLTRGDAGLLRQALEAAGAGVSIRRSSAKKSFAAVAASTSDRFERSIAAAEQSLERAIRTAERSIGEAAKPARAKAKRPKAVDSGDRSRRVEALRTPTRGVAGSPPAPAWRSPPPIEPPRPRPESGAAEAFAAPPSPHEAGTPAVRALRPEAGARIARLAASRDGLRDAFILQELLRQPLSERPGGVGGRMG